MPEQEISLEQNQSEEVEKTKTQELINEFKSLNYRQEGALQREEDIKRILIENGETAADLVLEELNNADFNSFSGYRPEFFLCDHILFNTASEKHISKIIDLLLRDDIVLNTQIINMKHGLLRVLENIIHKNKIYENKKIIEKLLAYSQKVLQCNYGNTSLNRGDLHMILGCLNTMEWYFPPNYQNREIIDLFNNAYYTIEEKLHNLPIEEERTVRANQEFLEEESNNENQDSEEEIDRYAEWNEDKFKILFNHDRLISLDALLKEKGLQDKELEKAIEKIRGRHSLEFKENKKNPYTPTIGIEIEVPKRYMSDAKTILDYQRTTTLGIPPGEDAGWEFSNWPVHYYLTLPREVQQLIHLGLIQEDKKRFPLHISLGGIKEDKYNSPYLLLHSLEATGWTTDEERLKKPWLRAEKFESHDKRSWNRRGVGGITPQYSKIDLPGKEGESVLEFRTFQLQSLAGLDRTLRSIYYLGAALKAYQTPIDKNDLIKGQLAHIWHNFDRESTKIFERYNLPRDYYNPWIWDKEQYTLLANELKNSRKKQRRKELNLMQEMKGLISKTRGQIAYLVEK